jgi:hypothetical protein
MISQAGAVLEALRGISGLGHLFDRGRAGVDLEEPNLMSAGIARFAS